MIAAHNYQTMISFGLFSVTVFLFSKDGSWFYSNLQPWTYCFFADFHWIMLGNWNIISKLCYSAIALKSLCHNFKISYYFWSKKGPTSRAYPQPFSGHHYLRLLFPFFLAVTMVGFGEGGGIEFLKPHILLKCILISQLINLITLMLDKSP